MEFVGESQAPSLVAEAGAFDGQRRFTYTSFQVASPAGRFVIDGAVDGAFLAQATDGKGRFDAPAYERVLAAMETAARILITHEHPDHIMAIVRHPRPEAIAPHLLLTRPQLAGLPRGRPEGQLAPAIANIEPLALAAPTRIAPGIVAAPAPGHSPGSIVIFVHTAARDFLFIGDIAWQMSSIAHAQGRPRLIRLIMPAVDVDRPAVLAQVRALHDLAAAEPALVIVPAHDLEYLQGLVRNGSLTAGFAP